MLRQADLPQQHLCADCADKHLCFPSLQDHEDLLNEARLRLINVQKVGVCMEIYYLTLYGILKSSSEWVSFACRSLRWFNGPLVVCRNI